MNQHNYQYIFDKDSAYMQTPCLFFIKYQLPEQLWKESNMKIDTYANYEKKTKKTALFIPIHTMVHCT